PATPPHISTLFPYTTLFRSRRRMGARTKSGDDDVVVAGGRGDVRLVRLTGQEGHTVVPLVADGAARRQRDAAAGAERRRAAGRKDRKSTRLNSSHVKISYAV